MDLLDLSDKVTLEALKSHLWKAADILRGSLDASEYREPVMTILFLKRLNDRFEENVENLIKEGKSEKEANQDFRHDFFVPKEARWEKLSTVRSKVGEKIDEICRTIEKANDKLEGVLTATKYSDPRKYPDDNLGYISDSELNILNSKYLEKIRETNSVEAKFMEKYGVDKTMWSDDVTDEYEYELEDT